MVSSKEVQGILEEILDSSYQFYADYIHNELSENCNDKSWVGFNGGLYLKKYILQEEFGGKTVSNKGEIEGIFEELLANILNEFLGKYLSNKAIVISILYNYKKINLF